MKTKKFIKEIKSMGFHVKNFEKFILIVDSNYLFVAKASKESVGKISTDYPGFTNLDYNTKLRLLDLLSEYAKTPIEDREEEEKFKLKQKGISGKYLIWFPESDEFTTGSSPFSNTKELFSQEEIDNMPERYKHPAVWEKINVEREE